METESPEVAATENSQRLAADIGNDADPEIGVR